jgi:hypothetical protein
VNSTTEKDTLRRKSASRLSVLALVMAGILGAAFWQDRQDRMFYGEHRCATERTPVQVPASTAFDGTNYWAVAAHVEYDVVWVCDGGQRRYMGRSR